MHVHSAEERLQDIYMQIAQVHVLLAPGIVALWAEGSPS